MNEEPRYHLAPVDGGALLLDLESGSLMELNASAALVWRLHIAGQSHSAVASELSARYGLDEATATSHVDRALTHRLGSPQRPTTDFDYANIPSGYLFSLRQQPVLFIDREGQELRLPEGTNLQATVLASVLHALAPKLLALRGHVVLHAAAVELDDKVIAFSGLSGAGKSTTARALVSAGASLVCEDQMAVSVSESKVSVPLLGEQAISGWINTAAADLAMARRTLCEGLDRVLEGEHAPLFEIGFIDSRRRTPRYYQSSRLSNLSTSGAVFRNTFYGADSRLDWRKALDTAVAIGTNVSGWELSLPDGLQQLGELGRRLVEIRSLKVR